MCFYLELPLLGCCRCPARKTQIADWPKKSQHWRESRSLKKESGHNKCQCPPAQEVAEVGRGEEYEVSTDATKLPSVNLATTQKTLTQNAIAKLSKIFKYTVKAGKLGYKELAKQAKKHIKNNEKAILEMVRTYGKIYAKKWLEKRKTGSSGFRKMLYEAAIKLISSGDSGAPKDITSESDAIDLDLGLINFGPPTDIISNAIDTLPIKQ